MYRIGCSLLALLVLAVARPVLAQGYKVTDLGILPDKITAQPWGAHSINEAGRIVGHCNNADPTAGIFGDYFTQNVPFLWTKKGGMKALPLLPGAANASALALNERGQIIGIAETAIWMRARFSGRREPSGTSERCQAIITAKLGA